MTKTRVQFDKGALHNAIYENVKNEQIYRLIVYAQEKIEEIGNKIASYNSINHMDRSGNLLDSLCWGVSYEGKLVEGGFYRPKTALYESSLHEFFSGEWYDHKAGRWEGLDYTQMPPVNGHELAQQYLDKYGNNGTKGFRVFFAILAPYWGYWEKGFHFKKKAMTLRFAVMAEFYDQVKRDLRPKTKKYFNVSVPKYTSTGLAKYAKRHL